MHNIFLFARREYLETVRKKSFIVMTILLPAMMFGFTVLPSMIASKKSGEVQHIVIATSNPQFADQVREQFEKPSVDDANAQSKGKNSNSAIRNFDVQIDTNVTPQEEDALTQRVNSHEIDGYLWAPPDAVAERKLSYRSRNSGDLETVGELGTAVRQAMLRQTMRSHGASAEEIDQALKPVDVQARKIENGKVTESSGIGTFFSVILLMVLLYVTILMYSMSVMRSVLEEKNSRIFEVLLSTATPKELMAGKILGAAGVGLTQIGIWTLAVTPFAAQAITIGGDQFHLTLSIANMIFFGVFFVLGFVLYAALAAALGAAVNSEQEAQQFQFVIMMPMIVSVIFMTPVILQPHSTMSTVLSLIPFCTPLLMYIRVIVETPPVWQIALSLVLLVGTIYAMLAICSRIYRVGILMYGKRPTLPEIMKWLKYA
ncbi:MAG: ABC transporter permease [Acidobacteria bacterium]|nr:ABC transporter permease [Acidobacteriota bacterium]MBV9146094.1 ABC transporter permease [Acidobacteriota bacterium]MBV9437914.1 ABC transporter permease [Acidobacteriota bacterium]